MRSLVTRPTSTHSATKILPWESKLAPCGATNLPGVKALGLFLPHRGTAQVSMNLTDFARTSVQTAFDAVAREAASRGVGVRQSELIGLIPEAALAGTTPERLLLGDFSADRILERRIESVTGLAVR